MFKRKSRHIPETSIHEMTLVELLKKYLISKLPKPKTKISEKKMQAMPTLPEDRITHIAIVYDNVVEDVMRAENRLASLLLSNPEFIEFDPTKEKLEIGFTKYEKGKFINITKEAVPEEEIQKLLKKYGATDE
jgi:hypothetical protein